MTEYWRNFINLTATCYEHRKLFIFMTMKKLLIALSWLHKIKTSISKKQICQESFRSFMLVFENVPLIIKRLFGHPV